MALCMQLLRKGLLQRNLIELSLPASGGDRGNFLSSSPKTHYAYAFI